MTPRDRRLRVLLYEGHGSQPLDDALRYELTRTLLEKGYPVTGIRPAGRVSSAEAGCLLVLGRFDDKPGLPDGAGTDGVEVKFQSIEGLEASDVVALVETCRDETGTAAAGAWKPWFPVIDYDRCTNCMQCLSFCLFDVYGVSPDGKIQVQNQNKCKTDCPACSRVCPEVAILFPKYRAGPINGDEVNPEDVEREAMKVDISALLGGDVYALLRDRHAKAKTRFAKERDEDRALKERQRCLVKLQQQMDVPPEVLASLPSPDEIRERAERAQARAAAALEANESSAD